MSDWNAEALARLRSSAAAAPILAALEGEAGVWVVGGAVRDVLLGRPFGELDLVVEGEAAAVARRAAQRLGGTALAHDRFATATVTFAGGAFDLTSARTESYPQPGALPVVAVGASVADDLGRRDFSVNALAVRLADGAGAAWPGALEDLRGGVLRVLHPRSFRDDPTRLLRLARYVARLGFAAADETAALASQAVASGAVATVSGSRLGEELRLLLREPQPAGVEALAAFGLAEAVAGPGFSAEGALVRDALELLGGEGIPSAVVLAACLSGSVAGEVGARLDELAFPAGERDAVVRAVARAAQVADRLAAGGSDSQLYFQLRPEGVETVALAGALAGGVGRDAALRWLRSLRDVRLAIDGHDLVAAGLRGPAVGAALDRALAAHLEGRAPDRESQLAAALAAR